LLRRQLLVVTRDLVSVHIPSESILVLRDAPLSSLSFHALASSPSAGTTTMHGQ